MKLRTEICIPSSEAKIDHSHQIYLMGSCFSESMVNRLNYFGFNVLSNSHGIIYNPVSIERALNDVADRKEYALNEILSEGDKYLSLHHHGIFDEMDTERVVQKINQSIHVHHDFLKGTEFLFITLGTAWVYTWKETGEIVANCHKIPANRFTKRLLELTEIEESLRSMVEKIQTNLPSAKIVFTLSPVKHLKDGFVENQRSKSLLHVAIQNCLSKNVAYFPAYEIMNDDLRDYRFWTADMAHPNELAVDYIWEKFTETYFNKDTRELMTEVKKLQQFLAHRSLSDQPDQIEGLEMEKKNKLNDLKLKYPQLNL